MSTTTSSANNLWFGTSMALVGVIVGYVSASVVGGFTTANVAAPAVPSPAQPTAQAPTAPPPAPDASNVEKVDTKRDHIKGDPKALISVIEYSDFECPFCKRHHPTMEALIEEVDDVNWVYRHFPLGFHPNAQKSAEASECAGEQGKFWEYSDMIFEKGPKSDSLVTYAGDLGLDTGSFEDCLNSGKYEKYVKDQMAAGSAAGVRGTPGNIVLNNKTGKAKLVSGAQGVDAFKAAIEELK